MKVYKSRFNYIYKHNKNEWVFYNTFTNALILLNYDYKLKYDNIEQCNDKIFIDQMINLGFLLENCDEDFNTVNVARKKTACNKKVLYLRVLTTTCCNARCSYCYEKGFKSHTMMLETADKLVKYILALPKLDKFYIHWFGGEPLINTDIIYYVMDKIYDTLTKNDTKVFVYFTSNGSLITKKLALDAKTKWHTNWFQITLDGLNDDYNVIKNYISKKYDFNKVVNNIGLLLENNIQVILRINYKSNELYKVKDIIDYICNIYPEYCKNKKLIFSPAPIFDVLSDKNKGIKKLEFYNLFLPNKYLIEKGFLNFNEAFGLMFKSGQCYACHCNSVVVDPLGNLFKCTVTMSDKEKNVGNLDKGLVKNENYNEWFDYELPSECLSCKFLPICQGGCKAGYLGYMDVTCKRIIPEIDKILDYRISMNLHDEKANVTKDIYLD